MFQDVSFTWMMINYSVDILFFTDMVVIFNTAIYDEDFQLVEDR